ncbi:hypothetical protein, partial [uncultured Roseibium sp.]|uniref:hypothetical protein n=1 Tax=uncultured Roseibium sp. TaxID=1936171 RepID=UPI00342C0085
MANAASRSDLMGRRGTAQSGNGRTGLDVLADGGESDFGVVAKIQFVPYLSFAVSLQKFRECRS